MSLCGTFTKEKLLAAGYQFSESHSVYNHASGLYQKAIRINNSIAFYLNIWWYPEIPGKAPEGWQPEAQLNTHRLKNEPPTFNVTLLDYESIEQVEAFFIKLYTSMGCVPYSK